MKTYNNIYKKLCSIENLRLAYEKAKKGKSRKESVVDFTKNLEANLDVLHKQLLNKTYTPRPLRGFIIRDPKTRKIHASAFRDRVVHHALINVIEPIFEPRFIHDSFASRRDKGTHGALKRFDKFKKRVTHGGTLVNKPYGKNSVVGFVFKADIKHFFDTVNHEILISIINKHITDKNVIWLIKSILDNFNTPIKGKGMPLGNYTSQFFANVYLTKLDYFVKHTLKAKYYIRYVDDFVILEKDRDKLEDYWEKIINYLKWLKLDLHPDKCSIIPIQKGVPFLGYRVFYKHKLLRKRNLRHFIKKFEKWKELYAEGLITTEQFNNKFSGWVGYSQWANTHKLRKRLKKDIGGGRS